MILRYVLKKSFGIQRLINKTKCNNVDREVG